MPPKKLLDGEQSLGGPRDEGRGVQSKFQGARDSPGRFPPNRGNRWKRKENEDLSIIGTASKVKNYKNCFYEQCVPDLKARVGPGPSFVQRPGNGLKGSWGDSSAVEQRGKCGRKQSRWTRDDVARARLSRGSGCIKRKIPGQHTGLRVFVVNCQIESNHSLTLKRHMTRAGESGKLFSRKKTD